MSHKSCLAQTEHPTPRPSSLGRIMTFVVEPLYSCKYYWSYGSLLGDSKRDVGNHIWGAALSLACSSSSAAFCCSASACCQTTHEPRVVEQFWNLQNPMLGGADFKYSCNFESVFGASLPDFKITLNPTPLRGQSSTTAKTTYTDRSLEVRA